MQQKFKLQIHGEIFLILCCRNIVCRASCLVFRLGIVFVANDEEDITGFDDASVAMLNLYNFVKVNNGIQKALNVLIEVKNCQAFFIDVPQIFASIIFSYQSVPLTSRSLFT